MKWLTGFTNNRQMYVGLSGSSSNPTGTTTFNTGAQPFTNTAGSTGNSGQSVWNSVFGNLGGIFAGAGSLVTSLKADPNRIAEYQAQASANNWQNMIGLNSLSGGNKNNNTALWVIGIVLLVAVVLFFTLRK